MTRYFGVTVADLRKAWMAAGYKWKIAVVAETLRQLRRRQREHGG